eukprot:g3922.t1
MAKRVHISRQGSIDVTNEDATGPDSLLNRPDADDIDSGNLNLTRDLLNENEDGFRGTATFRDRAKNAIERTLSPGSEFSFGVGSSGDFATVGEEGMTTASRLVDVETGKLSDVHVRDELNETLRRLEGAANREGALRMENYYLRSNAGRSVRAREREQILSEEIKKQRRQEAKDSVSTRNLILKCAMLEEKLEKSEMKCRRAETTMEALVQQLRYLRRSRSEEALEKEQKLYSRLEENMANIFDVSGPLLQQEQNAHSRHEAIATHLTQIDSMLRRQVAALKVQVKKLEGENSSLREELKLRPKLKDYKYLLYRENALHNVIKQNVNNIDFSMDTKNNVIYDGDRDAYVEKTSNVDGDISTTRKGILKDRSLQHVDVSESKAP